MIVNVSIYLLNLLLILNLMVHSLDNHMSLGMSRYVYSVLVVIATISLLGCVEFFGRGGASFSNPGTSR